MDVSRWQTSLGTLGTSICHVGSSLANGLSSLAIDSTDREKVSFVTFSHLEYTSSKPNSSGLIRRPVLLIGYTTGFQVWDLGSGAPNVLVSRREGPVRYENTVLKSSLYSHFVRNALQRCNLFDLGCFGHPISLTNGLCMETWQALAPHAGIQSDGSPCLVCLACSDVWL